MGRGRPFEKGQQSRFKTPQHILDAAATEYEKTQSIGFVSKKFGVGKGTLAREFKKRGMALEASGRKKPQDILDSAVEMRLQGLSFEEIQRLTSVSEAVVYGELKRRGIVLNSQFRGAKKQELLEVFEALQDVELTASHFGITRECCRRALVTNGVEIVSLRFIDPVRLDNALKAFLSGKTHKEINSEFGIGMKTLNKEIKKRGLQKEAHEAHKVKVSAAIQKVPVELWTGTLYTKNSMLNVSPEWKKWRGEVLSASNSKCADCGSKKRLQAHHIFTKSKYPYLVFEAGNGIALCKECHAKVRHHEHEHAPRYLSIIGSTLGPLHFFDIWPDDPRVTRKRKPRQLSLF